MVYNRQVQACYGFEKFHAKAQRRHVAPLRLSEKNLPKFINFETMHQISIWEKESYFKHHDIIIVGSGFVGLWSAYHLKRKHPKLQILIVERGVIPTGASTRNAGFACFGSVTELVADTLKFGEEKMLDIVKIRFDGLEKIKKTFKNKEIDFEEFGGYELISESQKMDINILRTNIDFLNHKIKDNQQAKSFPVA